MTSPIRRGDSRRVRETFSGPVIHCTHWRDQQELDRLHVAVIGGGSALARVVPPVVEQARRVTVFQHDPIWILPTPPVPGAGLLLRQFPADALGSLPSSTSSAQPGIPADDDTNHGVLHRLADRVLRLAAAANLRAQIGDSWQRRQLTPDRAAAIRVHGRYYRALRRPNCRVVSWPIARLAPLGIRTVDGVEHRVDCIIYAEESL
ncbi:hypothetical protein [Nocardia concava]|uniref:hypothetical protein n=1 Tax=Nocardia concava TaxID=257281 RepID=UPI0002FEEED5|nr:hypothetical protein [Nocardia concava]